MHRQPVIDRRVRRHDQDVGGHGGTSGHHGGAFEWRPRQASGDARAQRRESTREARQAFELVLVPGAPPLVVIAVLLAAPVIVARRLQVSVRSLANPDVLPCGRNDERSDPRQRVLVADGGPYWPPVRERPAGGARAEG